MKSPIPTFMCKCAMTIVYRVRLIKPVDVKGMLDLHIPALILGCMLVFMYTGPEASLSF